MSVAAIKETSTARLRLILRNKKVDRHIKGHLWTELLRRRFKSRTKSGG